MVNTILKKLKENLRSLHAKKVLPAHYQLNLRADFVDDVSNAFHKLHQENKLHQGNGIFEFGDFQIHI